MKLETQKTEKSKNMDVGMKKSSRESFRWVVRQASCHMPHDPQTSTKSRDETREADTSPSKIATTRNCCWRHYAVLECNKFSSRHLAVCSESRDKEGVSNLLL